MKTLTCGIGATLCLSLLACDPSAPELGPQDTLAEALTTTTGPITLPLPDPCRTSAANATAELGSYSTKVQAQGQMPPPPLSLPGSPTIIGCTDYVAEFTVAAASLAPLPPPAYEYNSFVALGGSADFGLGGIVTSTDCGKVRGTLTVLQQKSGATSFTSVASGSVKGVFGGGTCHLDADFPLSKFLISTSGVDKYRVKLNATVAGQPIPVTAFMYRDLRSLLH